MSGQVTRNFRTYLGDGVYIDCVEHQIVLTTEDGIRTTNRIVFDAATLQAFLIWIDELVSKGHES